MCPPLCALVIGCGSIGRRHIRSLQALEPDTRFVLLRRTSVCDDLSRSLNAVTVSDLVSALAHGPDFAVVATPTALHHEVLEPLVRAGVPFYVEKPVVATRTQVERLRAVLAEAGYGAPSLVGCNLRFLPSLVRAAEVIRSGRLGQVVRASFVGGQWLPDWRPGTDYRLNYGARTDLGGGVVFDLIHEIDAARWLLGEFDRVQSMLGHFSRLEITTEDTACALLGRSAGGPIVSLALDYVSRRRVRHYEVVGDEATLVWDLPARRLELATADGVEGLESGPNAFDVAATYVAAMREFIDAVRNGRPTSQGILDGLASTELALAIKENGTT